MRIVRTVRIVTDLRRAADCGHLNNINIPVLKSLHTSPNLRMCGLHKQKSENIVTKLPVFKVE
jgi:hypothetical protein